MVDPEFLPTPNNELLLGRSVETGICAYEAIFDSSRSKRALFALRETDDEKYAGLFPARTYIDTRTIVVHNRTLSELYDNLSQNYDISRLDLIKVYVSCGVITTLVGENISARNKRKVQHLYGLMASPESVVRSIQDTAPFIYGETMADMLTEAVLRKSEAEICEVNRLRLAIGSLNYFESLAGNEPMADRQQLDFGNRVTQTFREGLGDYLSHQESFEKIVVEALGFEQHAAQMQFQDEILPVEIAMAFPMGIDEITSFAHLIQDK